MHDVELEAIEQHPETFVHKLLDGARAFPPEDCGGVPGYQRCCQALEPGRARTAGGAEEMQERQELLEWLGSWRPERFDLEATRERFDGAAIPRARRAAEPSVGNARPEPSQGITAAPRPGAPTVSRPAGMGWHLFRIVRAGSTHPPGESVTTGLACIRRPGRRPCPGRIVVRRHEREDEIEWRCSDCSDGGSISGWPGGGDDFSEEADAHRRRGEEETSIRLPLDVYGALVHERNIAIVPSRFLYSARASAGQVELRGDLGELEVLHEETCDEVNHQELGKHHERLEAALEVFRAALRTDLSADREAAEEAAVAAATHGLRETGETLVLERKVREILGVREVRYRELRHFLGRISDFLERVEEFGRRAPSGGLRVCRSLLKGIGEMAANIHADENDLGVENRAIAEAAIEMAGRLGSTSEGLRPLLVDLLDLWLADDCCAFYFVPDLVAKLELGERERSWLLERIDERRAGRAGAGAEELKALADRLR